MDTLNISIDADADAEEAETRTLGLGDLPNGVKAGAVSQPAITIVDNEVPSQALLGGTMNVGNFGGYKGRLHDATRGEPNGEITGSDFVLNGVTYTLEVVLTNPAGANPEIGFATGPGVSLRNMVLQAEERTL